MMNKIYTTLLCLTSLTTFVSSASGQTLFSRPDTSPDYASYKHFDECIAALSRLKRLSELLDPVWTDTVDVDSTAYLKKRDIIVVEPIRECLKKRNLDSLSVETATKYIDALLVANRDDDVMLLINRVKDSIAAEKGSISDWLLKSSGVLMSAQPARLEQAKSLYDEAMSILPEDSVLQVVQYMANFASYLYKIGKHEDASKIADRIIKIVDTVAIDKYKLSANRAESEKYHKESIYSFATKNMLPEAVDSLKVSTSAYRKYLAKTMRSVLKHEPTDDEIGHYGQKAPKLAGHYWYSNENNTITKTDSFTAPEDSVVTIIYFVGGGCHSNSVSVSRGRSNGRSGTCWGEIHKIRKILDMYPTIKLVLVTNTYGNFGDAPPLTPDQEADTLANYFLGFHNLRGKQIVYRTDFITLPGSDKRRIDLDTDNQLAYKDILSWKQVSDFDGVVLVDEAGEIFHVGKLNYEAFAVNQKIKAVMSRPRNRTSAAVRYY